MTLQYTKKKELESSFIEVVNLKGNNLIIRYIYRHPSMNPTEFIDVYMLDLLQKISKEDKTVMLMGDFNIDLLKYDTNAYSTAFLDSMYTNFFSLTSQPQHGLQHSQKHSLTIYF